MKTRQSTGYFQQVFFVLLLCLISSLISAGSAFSLTLGKIDACYDCHGSSNDIRPLDSTFRNPANGAFVGNHQTHISTTTSTNACATCHGPAPTVMDHRDGQIYLNNGNIKNGTYTKGPFFNQTSVPALGSCSGVNCHFKTVTPDWGTTPTWASTKVANVQNINCAACHSATTLASGTHNKHIIAGGNTQAACKSCHPDYNALAGTAAFQHATSAARPINVNFSAAPNLAGTYAGGRTGTQFLPGGPAATGTCSATYCHSQGKRSSNYEVPKTTPVWGLTLACDGCHGASPGFKVISSGSHTGHITGSGGSTYTQIKCVTCHAATSTSGMTIVDVAKHVNKLVDVAFDNSSSAANGSYNGSLAKPGSPSSKAPGSAVSTCQNVYCHSTGQHSDGTALVAADYQTPTWGVPAGGQCGTCHALTGSTSHGGFGGYVKAGPAIASGKHTKHLSFTYGLSDNSSNDYRCAVCHANNKAAFTTANPSSGCTTICHNGTTATMHANNQINVNIANYFGGSAAYSGTPKPGDGYGSCTAVYCHSDGQATPGYDPTVSWSDPSLTCTSCHGGATVNSPAGTVLSGKHAAHVNPAVNTQLGTGNGFGCVECHQMTVSSNTALNGTTGAAAHVNKFVEYTGARAGGPLRYNSTTKQCSSFYCHSNGKAGTTVAEYKNPPAWNSATTLGCNGCHGNNTVLPDAASLTNANLGQPNYTNGGAGLASANSHKKHVIEAGMSNTTGCYNCHAKTVDKYVAGRFRPYSTTHVSGSFNIVFSPAIGGTYTPGVGSKTCASVACHGAGTPQWGGVSLACNSCHSANNVLPGAHSQHWENATLAASYTAAPGNTGTSANYLFQCSSCHASTASHSNLTNAASNFGSAEVFFGYTSTNRKGSYSYGVSTIGTEGTIKWTAGSNCNTTYCHSNGAGGNPITTSFTWNSANGTLGCNDCHGDAATVGKLLNTGKHQQHINNAAYLGTNFTCAACHAKTVAVGSAPLTDKTRHVNKMVDYSGVRAGKNKTCANFYCHSDGKGNYANPAAWAAASSQLTCTTCHDRSATGTSASHPKHLANATITCASCHKNTAASNTALAAGTTTHINGSYNTNKLDVRFAAFNTYTGSYNKATKSCSATYCHTSGKLGVAGMVATDEPISPVWSNVFAVSCKSCHGASTTAGSFISLAGEPNYPNGGTGATNANSHQKHTKAGALSCANCHSKTTATGTSIVAGSQHLNNFINYTAGNGKIFNKPSAKTCSNISCHSGNGLFVVGSATWGNTLNCKGCHATLSAIHAKHIDAVNFQNVIYASTADNSTLSAYNFGCANCHPVDEATYHMNGTVNISLDKTEGGPLKSLNNVSNKTSGYTQTQGSSVICSASYCHSNGAAAGTTVYATTPNWFGGSFANADNCKNCHGNSPTTGAHSAHVVGIHWDNVYKGYSSGLIAQGASGRVSHGIAAQSTTINCNLCHANTVQSSRNALNNNCSTASCHSGTGTNATAIVIYSKIKHINGTRDVSFANQAMVSKAQIRDNSSNFKISGSALSNSFRWYTSVWSRSTYKKDNASYDTARSGHNLTDTVFSNSNCSNVSCHNGKSANWTTDIGNGIKCIMCHTRL